MEPSPSEPALPVRPSPVQELAATLVQYAQARLRLVQIESREAGVRVISILLVAALGFGCLAFAWLIAMPALVWFLSQKLAMPWQIVSIATAGAHLFLALVLLMVLKVKLRRLRLFDDTLNELQKDREWLAPKKP